MNVCMIECPTCGEEKKHIGKHWRFCTYPSLSLGKRELIEGMVLGDGSVHNTRTNNFFTANMTNKKFLEWLDDSLGLFSNGVKLKATGEELAEKNKSNGLIDVVNPDEYRDSYILQSKRHPYFNGLRNIYYNNKGKHFPNNLKLTKNMAKMWYVSDGSLMWGDKSGNAGLRIGVRSQMDREEYLISLFNSIGFDIKLNGWNLQMGNKEAERFLDFLGEPVPGFEYKWENKNNIEYERLKIEAYQY